MQEEGKREKVRDALSSDLALDNSSYRTPAHAARLFCTLEIWPEIGRKYRPIYRFPANIPAANHLKTNLRLPFRLHGMEEVVGSIPTRSTNSFNNLADFLIRPSEVSTRQTPWDEVYRNRYF
jgi:hypothetical protein